MKKVLSGITNFHAKGFKKHLLAVTLCLSAGFTYMEATQASPNTNPPALKASAPNVYVVKRGDTLWDISGKFLSKPWRWPEIWASNKHVKNPHWIYPGDKLLLCTLDGRPLIGVDEGDGCEGIIRRYTGGTKLQPQARVESLNNAIPVIPLEYIKNWLEHSTILSEESLEGTPYIVGAADERVIAGKGQTVYARGQGIEVGQRYAIYREGEPYIVTDAEGKKQNLGLELTQVASAIAIRGENDMSTLEITDSYNSEVRRGYRVLPEYDAMLPTLFYPTHAQDVTGGGQVIRVQGSIGLAAKHSVVTIDRGTVDGVQSGYVFSVSQKGQEIRDPKTNEKLTLPTERIGNIMVFKTFDRVSYAYVLDSELPMNLGAKLSPSVVDE